MIIGHLIAIITEEADEHQISESEQDIMGVDEAIASPLDKGTSRSRSMRRLIGIASLLCSLHFVISIWWWARYVYHLARHDAFEIDWGMLLHAAPAVVLLCAFLLSYIFSRKHLKRAALVLVSSLIASTGLFLVEIGNNFYQLVTPVLHVGSQYFVISQGNRYHYLNWWWYRKPVLYSFIDESSKVDYKFGYINTDGSIAIELTFDSASFFSEGLAAVRKDKDGKYGYIDKSGRFIIEPKFENTNEFREGLAKVQVNKKWGFIDKSGAFIAPPQFEEASCFSEGLARVKLAGKFGYMHKNGQIAIAPKFDSGRDFHNGLAAVQVEHKWGFIDRTGLFAIEPRFSWVKNFSNGLAPVKVAGEWGYLDTEGKYIIKPQFSWAEPFSEGLAAVEIGHKRGYINTEGVMIIKPQFLWAEKFSDGFALVTKHNGRWGYRSRTFYNHLDKSGKLLSEQWFDWARPFFGGRALVFTGEKEFYIDKMGKVVLEHKFDSAGGFSEGLACVGQKVE